MGKSYCFLQGKKEGFLKRLGYKVIPKRGGESYTKKENHWKRVYSRTG